MCKIRFFTRLAIATILATAVVLKADDSTKAAGKRWLVHGHLLVAGGLEGGEDQSSAHYSDPSFRGHGRSGIRGVVMAWPISPVSRLGEPDSVPLPYSIVVVSPVGGEDEIVRQRADAEGRFQIAIAPGTYKIVSLPPRTMSGGGKPEVVTVPAGKFVDVVVYYDTGIR